MEKILGCQVNAGREHKRITEVTVTPRVLGTGGSGWEKKKKQVFSVGKTGKYVRMCDTVEGFFSHPKAVGCTFIRAFLTPEDSVSVCQDYPWPYLV